MRIFQFCCFVCLLLVFLNNTAMAQSGSDIGIPGDNRPKPVKTKVTKIKYQFHNGEAWLKSDLVIKGKFKYTEPKNKVPEYLFVDAESGQKRKVALSMIKRLVLAGTEPNITYRKDSTEFLWIDNYQDMYRKVLNGSIEVFDNSRVVDESYEYIPEYVFIASRSDYGYKAIREVADIELFTADRPYFMETAKSSGRYRSKDFRVIMYLINLFNDPTPMNTLKWEDMTIEVRGGATLKGKGYIQPLDMRNEFISSDQAFVHFYDGKDFKLYTNNDLKSVLVNGVLQTKGLYTVVNKTFYGSPWKYKEANYVVVKRIVNSNNYFYRSNDQSGQDIVIMKEVADSFLKPVNELDLRKAYLEELKNK